MNICKVENCNNSVHTENYCDKHLYRFRKYGNPLFTKYNKNYNEICIIEGCTNKHYSLDYCNKHYQRFKKYGDPLFPFKKRDNEMHGMSKFPEYFIWQGIFQRCYNKKDTGYHRYGGRGITVCERWLNSFVNFLDDMGKKPFPKAQIDREENDKGYYKDNCRWVTHKENSRKTSRTKLSMGKAREIRKLIKSFTVVELAIKYDVHKTVIRAVLNNKTWKE